MQKFLTFIFGFLLIATLDGGSFAFRAPELLGDAPAYLVRAGDHLAGLISADGSYLFAFTGMIDGREISCRITQIGGERIHDAEAPIPCYALERDGRWTGWIEFRGHQRKFCGADQVDHLPASCMLKGRDS